MVWNFTTDKFFYYNGDILYVLRNVPSELDAPDVIIVIFYLDQFTFVTLDSVTANSDGNFSTTIQVGGTTRSTYRIYPIQVTSEESSMGKSIEYLASSTTTSELSLEPTPESHFTPESIHESIQE